MRISLCLFLSLFFTPYTFFAENNPNIYCVVTSGQSSNSPCQASSYSPNSYNDYTANTFKPSTHQVLSEIIPGAKYVCAAYALVKNFYHFLSADSNKNKAQEISFQTPVLPQPYIYPAQHIQNISLHSQTRTLQEKHVPKNSYAQLQKLAHQQSPDLEIIQNEYQQELDAYNIWEHRAEILAQRLQAIKTVEQTPKYIQTYYALNPITTRFINEFGLEAHNYKICFGNQLQHVVHQEIIQILEKTAEIYYERFGACSLPEMNLLLDFTDLGCTYNSTGYTTKSILILDACWALLDGVQAVADGVAHGAWNAGKSLMHVAAHPLQTIHDIGISVTNIAYHIAHVATQVGGIWITSFTKPEISAVQYYEFKAKIDSVLKVLQNEYQKTSRYEILRHSSELATECILTGKCIGILASYFGRIHNQATIIAKNFRTSLSSDWHRIATTPEGISLSIGGKASEFMHMATQTTQEIGATILPKIAKVPSRVHEILNLSERVPVLQKMFDGTKVFIEGIGEMIITIDYEHIFGIDIKNVYQKARFIEQRLSGFHHDFMNRLENMGIITLHNIKQSNAGTFKADILIDEIIFKKKTFFPKDWSQEKVIEKIIESISNSIKKEMQPNGNWRISGIVSEGIEIETIMKSNGKIVTSYPKIE